MNQNINLSNTNNSKMSTTLVRIPPLNKLSVLLSLLLLTSYIQPVQTIKFRGGKEAESPEGGGKEGGKEGKDEGKEGKDEGKGKEGEEKAGAAAKGSDAKAKGKAKDKNKAKDKAKAKAEEGDKDSEEKGTKGQVLDKEADTNNAAATKGSDSSSFKSSNSENPHNHPLQVSVLDKVDQALQLLNLDNDKPGSSAPANLHFPVLRFPRIREPVKKKKASDPAVYPTGKEADKDIEMPTWVMPLGVTGSSGGDLTDAWGKRANLPLQSPKHETAPPEVAVFEAEKEKDEVEVFGSFKEAVYKNPELLNTAFTFMIQKKVTGDGAKSVSSSSSFIQKFQANSTTSSSSSEPEPEPSPNITASTYLIFRRKLLSPKLSENYNLWIWTDLVAKHPRLPLQMGALISHVLLAGEMVISPFGPEQNPPGGGLTMGEIQKFKPTVWLAPLSSCFQADAAVVKESCELLEKTLTVYVRPTSPYPPSKTDKKRDPKMLRDYLVHWGPALGHDFRLSWDPRAKENQPHDQVKKLSHDFVEKAEKEDEENSSMDVKDNTDGGQVQVHAAHSVMTKVMQGLDCTDKLTYFVHIYIYLRLLEVNDSKGGSPGEKEKEILDSEETDDKTDDKAGGDSASLKLVIPDLSGSTNLDLKIQRLGVPMNWRAQARDTVLKFAEMQLCPVNNNITNKEGNTVETPDCSKVDFSLILKKKAIQKFVTELLEGDEASFLEEIGLKDRNKGAEAEGECNWVRVGAFLGVVLALVLVGMFGDLLRKGGEKQEEKEEGTSESETSSSSTKSKEKK